MNILVYNVAAEYAGALTILKQFHNEVISNKDESHVWYFVVSTDELEETDNIKVIRVPWVKKSWLHRLWYDKFCAKKLVQQYEIDLVFSMQNMPIDGTNCCQVVYLHQPLQFSPVKYSFWKKEERVYWIRQNIICNIMKNSLKKADSIIVQTEWMKEATHRWLQDFDKSIQVIAPEIKMISCCKLDIDRESGLFIYPAGGGLHKNHKLIMESSEILKKKGISHRVLFTMNANESAYANKLHSEATKKGLNIEFVGFLTSEMVMRLYKKATLIFPSYLETFGLPLLEAKKSGDIILCSNLPYAQEIVGGYKNAYFFDSNNAQQLATYMEKCSKNVIRPIECSNIELEEIEGEKKTLVEYILEMG